MFAYHDAQLYRVGTNHQQLPVNRPRCPFHHQQRDGAMTFGAQANYAGVETPRAGGSGFGHGDPGWAIEGVAGRYDARVGDDHYTQAGNLYRLLPVAEKRNLVDNIARAMRGVSLDIIQRQLAHFDQADAAYGAGVRASLATLGVQLDV